MKNGKFLLFINEDIINNKIINKDINNKIINKERKKFSKINIIKN